MKIADIIRAGLADYKSTASILADVKAAFPASNTTAACVAFYRSKAKADVKAASAAYDKAWADYQEAMRLGQACDDALPAGTYVYDWGVSHENASDGLRANEGIDIRDMYESQWPIVALQYMTNNIHTDCGYRLVELGLSPADYGFKF